MPPSTRAAHAVGSGPGRITVTLGAAPALEVPASTPRPRAARYVRLAVTDTGAGMDPEALRRIFEPYFSTKATGTGLGLTIAKRNVELNGGTIHVQSAPGKGTTVVIELPTI